MSAWRAVGATNAARVSREARERAARREALLVEVIRALQDAGIRPSCRRIRGATEGAVDFRDEHNRRIRRRQMVRLGYLPGEIGGR